MNTKTRLFMFLMILAAAGLFVSLSGCIGKSTQKLPIKYYTLDYPPPPPVRESPLPYILAIDPLTALPPYNSNRIIYSSGSYTENFYTYFMWIIPPAEMVTADLARDLRASNLFSAVNLSGSHAPTHRLQGFVGKFYEQDQDGKWNAIASVTLTLTRENESDPGKKICFQKTFNARVPLDQNNPLGLAQSMSTGVSRISKAVIAETANAISPGKTANP